MKRKTVFNGKTVDGETFKGELRPSKKGILEEKFKKIWRTSYMIQLVMSISKLLTNYKIKKEFSKSVKRHLITKEVILKLLH